MSNLETTPIIDHIFNHLMAEFSQCFISYMASTSIITGYITKSEEDDAGLFIRQTNEIFKKSIKESFENFQTPTGVHPSHSHQAFDEEIPDDIWCIFYQWKV